MPSIFVSGVIHNYYNPNEPANFKMTVYYFPIVDDFHNRRWERAYVIIPETIIGKEGSIVTVNSPPANRSYAWRAKLLDGSERETVQTPLIYGNEGQQITFHFLGNDMPTSKPQEPSEWSTDMEQNGQVSIPKEEENNVTVTTENTVNPESPKSPESETMVSAAVEYSEPDISQPHTIEKAVESDKGDDKGFLLPLALGFALLGIGLIILGGAKK